MAKGKKSCVCGEVVAARQLKCPKCGHTFLIGKSVTHSSIKKKMSNKNKHFEKINWPELKIGDIILVKAGSGPYYIVNEERHSLGYSGTFRVRDLDDEGILAIPIKASETGYCYLFMGEPKIAKTGTRMEPHKIVRINEKSQKVSV